MLSQGLPGLVPLAALVCSEDGQPRAALAALRINSGMRADRRNDVFDEALAAAERADAWGDEPLESAYHLAVIRTANQNLPLAERSPSTKAVALSGGKIPEVVQSHALIRKQLESRLPR